MSARHKITNRTKFMGGRMTPEEVHAKIGIRKPCRYCNLKHAPYRVRLLATVDELLIRRPEWCAMVAALNPNGPTIPAFHSKYGPLSCIVDFGFCRQCRKRCEQEAAKMPSWVIVDFDWGPTADKIVSTVPGIAP